MAICRQGDARFPETRWTRIRRVRSGPVESKKALGELCGAYWYPVFAYIRRVSGLDVEDAEDLTQDFFAKLIERETFRRALEERGRLRNFLLAALKRFLIDAHRKTIAVKRGHDQIVDLNGGARAEGDGCHEGMHHLSPDVLFDRQWATALFVQVMADLEVEWERRGRAHCFRVLEPYIPWNSVERPQKEAADELGIPMQAVRKEVYRLRRCFAALLRETVRATVDSAEDVEREIAVMQTIFANR